MSTAPAPVRYLSTLDFSPAWLEQLRRASPAVSVEQIPATRPSEVPAEVWRQVEVLHTSTVLPEPGQAPNLRWVQLDTSGADHVRGTSVWSSPIPLTTIGGVSALPLAEYVLFAILGFAHRLPSMLAAQAGTAWPSDSRARWSRFRPAALEGATLAILGYGRVGGEIGRLARMHGLTVVAMNRSGRPPGGQQRAGSFGVGSAAVADPAIEVFSPAGLHEMLARADYLVVVLPLTAETRTLVDAAALAVLKPGAVVINVGRGGIVDESALREALHSGQVAGAVLDVFDDEPLPPDSPWWREPNVFVTPHVSGLAPRYDQQVLQLVSENLRRFQAGEPLLNCVERTRGY